MNPATLIRSTRELIADPYRWTVNCVARDVHGQSVMPEAVRFSGFDALAHLAPDDDTRNRAAEVLKAVVGPEGWNRWEDAPGRTHAEILAPLDRAIAAAEIVTGLAMYDM